MWEEGPPSAVCRGSCGGGGVFQPPEVVSRNPEDKHQRENK